MVTSSTPSSPLRRRLHLHLHTSSPPHHHVPVVDIPGSSTQGLVAIPRPAVDDLNLDRSVGNGTIEGSRWFHVPRLLILLFGSPPIRKPGCCFSRLSLAICFPQRLAQFALTS
ncbi:hypothetical protein KC19_8G182600 [Ceratodon purpureus]|uniref:Uncharacterized protein n=1 Tax=Ceratodon purpureus TaxID=3225 RepID=A0A8T0GZR3_CERPU|nr:hypothetical protein KC19_8G182600 [Ceratodon purpureus]